MIALSFSQPREGAVTNGRKPRKRRSVILSCPIPQSLPSAGDSPEGGRWERPGIPDCERFHIRAFRLLPLPRSSPNGTGSGNWFPGCLLATQEGLVTQSADSRGGGPCGHRFWKCCSPPIIVPDCLAGGPKPSHHQDVGQRPD